MADLLCLRASYFYKQWCDLSPPMIDRTASWIFLQRKFVSIVLSWTGVQGCRQKRLFGPPGWHLGKVTLVSYYKADSRLAPSQWETALLCNDVFHWLDASLEWALSYYHSKTALCNIKVISYKIYEHGFSKSYWCYGQSRFISIVHMPVLMWNTKTES